MDRRKQEVCAVMNGWIGLKESDGTHMQIVNIYNGFVPGYKLKITDAWCAATASAAYIQAGCPDIFPIECSCNRMIERAKQMGIWEERDDYTPEPGDAIFYDWQDNGIGDCVGTSEHVGIVTGVTSQIITVVEGNKSDAVGTRRIAVNSRFIRGYACPLRNQRKAENEALMASQQGFYPRYEGPKVILTEALKRCGEADTSLKHRKEIGAANGIAGIGTITGNTTMYNMLKAGTLRRC